MEFYRRSDIGRLVEFLCEEPGAEPVWTTSLHYVTPSFDDVDDDVDV